MKLTLIYATIGILFLTLGNERTTISGANRELNSDTKQIAKPIQLSARNDKKTIYELVCQRQEIENEDQCAKDLKALAIKESSGNPKAIGDKGCSYGLVQINLCVHKTIKKKQALDPVFALNWTLDRMIANGYPEYRTWAIGSHNSKTPSINAQYAKSVKFISANLK